MDAYQNEFVTLINANARRYRHREVFSDFCEMLAIAFSNAVDKRQAVEREARYMHLIGRYEAGEQARFPLMTQCIQESLMLEMKDSLGEIYMTMELSDGRRGQFFTPSTISSLMAKITAGDMAKQIEQKGFITVNDPAAGAGSTLIGVASEIRDLGLNYQKSIHVTTTDIDLLAVHMAYIQFSFLHVPAKIIHGNGLWPRAEDPQWVTPAHVLGGWGARLRQREFEECAARMKPLLQSDGATSEQFADGDAAPGQDEQFKLVG